MRIYYNNKEQITNADTLQAFLRLSTFDNKDGIAVAINNQVIPRDHWFSTKLQEDDKVIIITATQGG